MSEVRREKSVGFSFCFAANKTKIFMKTCIAGNGSDSTALVLAWLAANNELRVKNLYLIGRPDDPMALWLTDYESPLSWPCWSNEKRNPNGFPSAFDPAVIKRGTVTSKIGLEVQTLDLTWTPKNRSFTQNISTASPYQLAQLGYYDNWEVRVWTVYMPTPGDANTFGCSELFGGRIAPTAIARGQIQWTVNSFLDVVNQYVPTNVIELLNTGAAYTGATPPAGYSRIPQFDAVTGSSVSSIVGDETFPTAHAILDDNLVRGGYLVFHNIQPDPTAVPPVLGSTLGGMWSPILQNTGVWSGGSPGSGTEYNQFLLSVPLPFPPTPGRDSFYVSGAAPINMSDGSFLGFPFVPAATAGL
jgi:hypothetical protein